MALKRAVGIDLGTTFSVAAWIDPSGKTAVLPNREGELLTPSVVVFEDDGYVVGKMAKSLGVLKVDRLAECAKRDMGNPFFARPILGERLPPEVVQACILNKLRLDVTSKVGRDFGTVITVPAYFDDARRRATAMAGEMAGLHVLDIVNEPMAGALAYGEHLEVLRGDVTRGNPLTVLVYDLGGGTFDCTLLEISQLGFRTIATDGDVRLGGHDWDERLADMVSERFIRRFHQDPRDNPVSLQRLLREVEQAKRTLSARPRAVVRIDHGGQSLETEVTRTDFEDATADLLERTAHTARQLLRDAGMSWSKVQRVMLVGGASRMPMVARMLQELSGMRPETAVSPDEAVARGAAIYARYLLSEKTGEAPKFRITNVNAHNLGVQGVERDTGRRTNAVVVHRNTPLPTKAARRFVTHRPNQRSIAIRVLEGESSNPDECTLLGRADINNLPPGLPAGHPVKVSFEYATNARLRVHAQVLRANREVEIDIERRERLADEEIEGWRAVIGGRGDFASIRKLLRSGPPEKSPATPAPAAQAAPAKKQAAPANKKEPDRDAEILAIIEEWDDDLPWPQSEDANPPSKKK